MRVRMKKVELPRFALGDKLTPEQMEFFQTNGFILFKNFINSGTVKTFISEIDKVSKDLLSRKVEFINGIPLKFGNDEKGDRMIQRFVFASQCSPLFSEFLKDPRLQVLIDLLAPYDGRIGEYEKDGLVINYYKRTP